MTAFFRHGLIVVLWIVTNGDGEEMTYLGIDGTWTELTRERRDDSQPGSAQFHPMNFSFFHEHEWNTTCPTHGPQTENPTLQERQIK